VNDDTLGRIAQTTTNLEDLDLAGCSKITNGGLIFIGWGLKKTEKIEPKVMSTTYGSWYFSFSWNHSTSFIFNFKSSIPRKFTKCN